MPPYGLDRRQKPRGDRRGAVAIEDCWVWQMMAENLFSKTIIYQRQLSVTADNSHSKTSRPRRYKLNESRPSTKRKTAENFSAVFSAQDETRTHTS